MKKVLAILNVILSTSVGAGFSWLFVFGMESGGKGSVTLSEWMFFGCGLVFLAMSATAGCIVAFNASGTKSKLWSVLAFGSVAFALFSFFEIFAPYNST